MFGTFRIRWISKSKEYGEMETGLYWKSEARQCAASKPISAPNMKSNCRPTSATSWVTFLSQSLSTIKKKEHWTQCLFVFSTLLWFLCLFLHAIYLLSLFLNPDCLLSILFLCFLLGSFWWPSTTSAEMLDVYTEFPTLLPKPPPAPATALSSMITPCLLRTWIVPSSWLPKS